MATADPGLRARVERLLRGDYRQDDLTRLFLFARDSCDGREPVREIGDFVAHHNERVKGIVTRETSDWFTIVRVLIPAMRHPMDGDRLPSEFANFLDASFRRMPSRILTAETKLRRPIASRHLIATKKKLTKNPDGTLRFSPMLTKVEWVLVKCLCETLNVRPAFDAERLFADFSLTLKSHALLQKTELKKFGVLESIVALFAVTAMHNCAIRMPDGSSSKLMATVSSTIDVHASIPVMVAGKEVSVASSMFSTGLDARTYCEPGLFNEKQPWQFDLEVSPNKLLARLG